MVYGLVSAWEQNGIKRTLQDLPPHIHSGLWEPVRREHRWCCCPGVGMFFFSRPPLYCPVHSMEFFLMCTYLFSWHLLYPDSCFVGDFKCSAAPFLTQWHIFSLSGTFSRSFSTSAPLCFLLRILTVNLDKDSECRPYHSPMLGCL